MSKYEMIPATKKRLKVSLEKIPYMKRKRVKRKSYEEIEFEKAKKAKTAIMTDKTLLSYNMRIQRSERLFNNKNFKTIREAGVNIRKQEVKYYFYFACVLVAYAAIVGLLAYFLNLPILYLTIAPIFFICKTIIRPKVRFKDLFLKIYLPVCYFCANVKNEDDTLSFDIADKQKNWDRKTTNHKIITNQFKVKMKKYTANIQKMIIRNWLTTYKMVNGKIEVGRKLATIFSGYSFEINYSHLTERYSKDDIVMAIINPNTFNGTDGLYEEDSSALALKRLTLPLLKEDWCVYIREGFDIDKKKLKEIEKKIVMISNEVGPFNAYITSEATRMMINIHSDKSGFKEEFLQVQLKNPEALTFNGFYSIIKTLCVTGYMNKLIRILFNIKEEKIYAEDESLKRISKPKLKNVTENAVGNKKNNGSLSKVPEIISYDKEKKKRILFHKKGEASIDTAIGLILSVVLATLLLTGFIGIINKNMGENTIAKTNSVYTEADRPSTVTESLLIE